MATLLHADGYFPIIFAASTGVSQRNHKRAMHYLTMKTKGLALLIMSCLLVLLAPTSSYADSTPSPSPSPDFQTMMKRYKAGMDQYQLLLTPSTDSQTAQERYRAMMEQFQDLQKARDNMRMQINRTFMKAVDAANKDARSAMKSAKSASAKSDVINRQKAAIALASDARDLALTALGAIPTPPAKPIQQGEMSPKGKMKNKKR